LCAEFVATDKRRIRKCVLAAHSPAMNVSLTRSELSILQTWLAIRYRRSAFPDEFDQRIKLPAFYKKFLQIIKDTGNHLLAVLFDVEDVEHQRAEDTYSLMVFLLFNVEEDPEEARANAERA